MRNIYLMGAHGTGKSTLVRALQEKLPNMKLMTDMSKLFLSVEEKDVQTDYNSEEFLKFQKRIFLWCAREYVFAEDTIFSRSLVDSYAYILYAYEKTRSPYAKNALTQILNLIPTYLQETDGLYVYLPIEFSLTNDGNLLRPLDREYQVAIDRCITSFLDARHPLSGLKEDRLSYITVVGSVENRVKRVMEAYDTASV